MINGHSDQVRLDYHPSLSKPAISRYSATSPELLRWFKTYNATRPFRDQVKPFGFLLSMTECFARDGERIVGAPAKGRRKKPTRLKPIAPFDTNHDKAVALAFDRVTGKPVQASGLKSYADALAQYHLSPEGKFLNADYLDRGTTRRRHVRMIETRHIGKEAHDWERQAILGLSENSEIDYGTAPGDLTAKLQAFIAEAGENKAAKALRITAARLKAIVSRRHFSGREKLARKVGARLPAAQEFCEKFRNGRQDEFQRLKMDVERYGLRGAARRLGIDPSNLRRRLAGLTHSG